MSAILSHGEFLKIFELGIFITGPAGIGKSTLALELLDRGHQLVADDAVYFHADNTRITGFCPDLLKNYLSLRDVGILDIPALFGHKAVCPTAPLDLVIKLCEEGTQRQPSLRAIHSEYQILSLIIPEIEIIASKHRNLALVIETAVKNHILYRQGQDANQQLIQKQQHFI